MHKVVRSAESNEALLSADLGDLFLDHLSEAVGQLEKHGHPAGDGELSGFSHT